MFERQVLMRVSCQIGLAHLDDEIIQGLIRFDASAHTSVLTKNPIRSSVARCVRLQSASNQDVGLSAHRDSKSEKMA